MRLLDASTSLLLHFLRGRKLDLLRMKRFFHKIVVVNLDYFDTPNLIWLDFGFCDTHVCLASSMSLIVEYIHIFQ